jgi:hypothetical protein
MNRVGFLQRVREFMYGFTAYEFEQHLVEMRSALEMIFIALTFGDLIGLPIIPPYYALRMLPYVVPNIKTWKRRVNRERDPFDDHDMDLHGI